MEAATETVDDAYGFPIPVASEQERAKCAKVESKSGRAWEREWPGPLKGARARDWKTCFVPHGGRPATDGKTFCPKDPLPKCKRRDAAIATALQWCLRFCLSSVDFITIESVNLQQVQ